MNKVIVITGALSGFGALTARALSREGHTVYASMRETMGRNVSQVEGAKKFSEENGVDLRTIELDVASQESVDAAIDQIVKDEGRIDVVIHNAGHVVFGPAEAFTPEQLAELYDVNVLSTQRVNRAALSHLRKQMNGLVVWISSSSAAGGTPPYLAPYSAAKAGMDALPVARITLRTPALPRTRHGLGSRPCRASSSNWPHRRANTSGLHCSVEKRRLAICLAMTLILRSFAAMI